MVRFSLLVVALYAMCCGMALGQTTPPAAAARPGSDTREKPVYGAPHATDQAQQGQVQQQPQPFVAYERGGSMLRAGLAQGNAPVSVSHAAYREISVFAVPPPEPKMIKKNDFITIIIREESEVSSKGTSDLKRQSDIDASVESFARINFANFALQESINGAAPGVKASASRNFKGEATVDRTDSVIMRVTARVADVKPNGTLVLEARKKIKNDEEEQTLLCSGMCRVEDLTPDNTVLSTQLYDLEFSKMNKGQVRTSTKTGLVHKLLDFINPF